MFEGRTLGYPELSIDQDGAGNDNDRFTSLCTLDIRPEKKESKINPVIDLRRIFDTIKAVDDTAAIVTSDNTHITHSKDISSSVAYAQIFPNTRTVTITKRMYISFTLESTFTLSQVKYSSNYDGVTGTFELFAKTWNSLSVRSSIS